MKNKIIIFVVLALLVIPIAFASTTYTKSTKTVCNEYGKCTVTSYGRTRFVYEDKTWKKVEDARSLKGLYDVKYLKRDSKYDFEIVDYNYTGITLKPVLKFSGEIDEFLPVRVDGKSEWIVKYDSLDDREEVPLKLEKPLLGTNLTFGWASTTVTLEDGSYEIIADTYLGYAGQGTNYGGGDDVQMGAGIDGYGSLDRGMLKANLTNVIPAGQIIDEAMLWGWYNARDIYAADMIISAYHIYNQTWGELNVTYGTQPCGLNITDSSQCNVTAESNETMVSAVDSWLRWNITSMIMVDYNLGRANTSVLLAPFDETTDQIIGGRFRSRSFATVGLRPIINITYSAAPNEAPVIANVELNKTSGVVVGTPINCTTSFSDADTGDTHTRYYKFYADDTLLYNQIFEDNSTILTNFDGATGSTIGCAGQVYDGVQNATGWVASSLNATIPSAAYFSSCAETNATHVEAYNFSFNNEVNSTRVYGMDFDVTFELWNTTHSTNESFSLDNKDYAFFCFTTDFGKNYLTNATIEYDKNGYQQRSYFLVMNNVSDASNTTLYTIDDRVGTGITIHLLDEIGDPYGEGYIKIQRYDVGTGVYRLVAMGKSDSLLGEDYVYLQYYDAWYRFIIEKFNEVQYSSTATRVSSADLYITIAAETLAEYLDKYNHIAYTLDFDNSTSRFTLTYTDTSGASGDYCLKVLQFSAMNDSYLCDTCLTSSSGTIRCDASNYTMDIRLLATFYKRASPALVIAQSMYERVSSMLFDKIGIDGVVAATLITGTFGLACSAHPVALVACTGMGVIISSAFGLIKFSLGAIIGLVIVLIIIMVKMKT